LFIPYSDTGLEVHRCLRLMEHLSAPTRGDHLEFPLRASDCQRLGTLLREARFEADGYVCIHPGASVPERRWTAPHFGAVAQSLLDMGFQVILTGSKDETNLTHAVNTATAQRCSDLAGRTDLGTLAALYRNARLLVCNDTGVSHLAAALQLPSIVLSTSGNPARWAPQDAERHCVFNIDHGIKPADVMESIQNLVRRFPHHRESSATSAQ
jgi:ADP-heptose:LPS heptosyltransferase